MYFRFLNFVGLALGATALAQSPLRVCAHPNNLPFSNHAKEGFENRIAELIARDLQRPLEYVWWEEGKPLDDRSFDDAQCDLLLGLSANGPAPGITKPYYGSSYVFVTRADRRLDIASLNDSRLEGLRIGVQITGDDYSPPGYVLARRGLAGNLVAFRLLGDGANPPARIVDAVASGAVDIAAVWGPLAGYFAAKSDTRLVLTPISPATALGIPLAFDVSAAVKPSEAALKTDVERSLRAECGAIGKILDSYGVPRISRSELLCEQQQADSFSSH
jgi:mxaJ protein